MLEEQQQSQQLQQQPEREKGEDYDDILLLEGARKKLCRWR